MLIVAVAAAAFLQASSAPPKFEVASVKLNKSTDPPNSNFPLGPGDVYIRNGGRFSATGIPLSLYLSFAYKLMGNQLQLVQPQLPEWANTEHYDIEAKAAADPGKDGMRLAMRELLADRFKLALHYEDREMPVMAFVVAKTGKLGPNLRRHDDKFPCSTDLSADSGRVLDDGLPALCNGIYPLPSSTPGRLKFGGRNVTLSFIADTFSAGVGFGRPIVDATGLSGRFDFTLEFTPDRRGPGSTDAGADSDSSTLTFDEAVKDQLGLKLQSQKGTVKVLKIDHVERPSGN